MFDILRFKTVNERNNAFIILFNKEGVEVKNGDDQYTIEVECNYDKVKYFKMLVCNRFISNSFCAGLAGVFEDSAIHESLKL